MFSGRAREAGAKGGGLGLGRGKNLFLCKTPLGVGSGRLATRTRVQCKVVAAISKAALPLHCAYPRRLRRPVKARSIQTQPLSSASPYH